VWIYDDDDDDDVSLYKLQTRVARVYFHIDQPERHKYMKKSTIIRNK
jgi:hypothetical protein